MSRLAKHFAEPLNNERNNFVSSITPDGNTMPSKGYGETVVVASNDTEEGSV